MNTLPAELIDRISSLLDYSDLKHTLLLSPVFHAAAEFHSGAFARFRFDTRNEACDSFVST